MEKEDLRLLIGDKGKEYELPSYIESPTWVVDEAWTQVKRTAVTALYAYMNYCKHHNLPHSYLLGLDILIMGEVDRSDPDKVTDIRATMVEGPCCNSYPACPNLWSYRLYRKLVLDGRNPDAVEYPTHPSQILNKLAGMFKKCWAAMGHEGNPVVGVFTRPYEHSEEETAHLTTLKGFQKAGLEAYRITPNEKPAVKDGKIWVNDKPMDMCYRRIERIHVPEFYGEKLGNQIINETPNTFWINPWKIDDLRSKTKEERCFRLWESESGEKLSRPKTLLGDEITSENVRKLADRGGFAMKKWNSTGGKGVFLHIAKDVAGKAADKLYLRYDGRHMMSLSDPELEEELKKYDDFKEDTSIQQLRFLDARNLGDNRRLTYDTRINVIYDALNKKWEFLSGISRSVPCGPDVESGNSLLTNISAGAEISPLIMGYTKKDQTRDHMNFGPLMTALLDGKTEFDIKNID